MRCDVTFRQGETLGIKLQKKRMKKERSRKFSAFSPNWSHLNLGLSLHFGTLGM